MTETDQFDNRWNPHRSIAGILCIAMRMCVVCIVIAMAGTLPSFAQTTTEYHFEIPQQEVGSALAELARQAHLQLIYSSDLVEGETTRTISGSMTFAAALDQILGPAGLRYEFLDPQTVMISAAVATRPSSPLASQGAVSSAPSVDGLKSLTVQGNRDRAKLEHDVNQFVSSAIVHTTNGTDSLARWTQSVCPLVEGLSKDQGEYILARLSQIGRTAGVPLAPEKCRPNLYVIVTSDPGALLRKWRVHDPNVFNIRKSGAGALKRFIDKPRPIRVWYNPVFEGARGNFIEYETMGGNDVPVSHAYNGGSRLEYQQVVTISSAVVVIDRTRLGKVNFGVLSDYIALVGLAQIDLDKDLGNAPTILRLFRDPNAGSLLGMTKWDQSLLHSLYSTSQSSVTQISAIENRALDEIASNYERPEGGYTH
jgi:hypothetical protein